MPALTLRRSEERGRSTQDWLDSKHSFSFGSYHDPRHMGFRSLRVINEDRLAPGGGFPTHPHRDMEIFSYVLAGSLKHEDSLGNARVLQPGQVQLMSAGTGIAHSELNPSATEPVHFFQIWIRPRTTGLPPSYTDWNPAPGSETEPRVLLISPDGRDGSATIHQEAEVYRVRLPAGASTEHELRQGRGLWLQVVGGEMILADTRLAAGDGASCTDAGRFQLFAGEEPAEALLFDLGSVRKF